MGCCYPSWQFGNIKIYVRKPPEKLIQRIRITLDKNPEMRTGLFEQFISKGKQKAMCKDGTIAFVADEKDVLTDNLEIQKTFQNELFRLLTKGCRQIAIQPPQEEYGQEQIYREVIQKLYVVGTGQIIKDKIQIFLFWPYVFAKTQATIKNVQNQLSRESVHSRMQQSNEYY